MFFRRVLIIMLICLACNQASSYASWWDTKKLPVPPRTEEIRQENMKLKNGAFDLVYYASQLEVAALKDFYTEKLLQEGWREKDPMAELTNIDKAESAANLGSTFSDCLIFEKDNMLLVVRLSSLRSRSKNEKMKTNYVLSCHRRDRELGYLPGEYGPQASSRGLSKDVLPEHPAATLTYLLENNKSFQAGYYVDDSIEGVTEFYKTHMNEYNWEQEGESPLEKKDFTKKLKSGNIAKECPECLEKPRFADFEREGYSRQLSFSNQAGDSCKISLFSSVYTVDKKTSGQTMILVNYEKK